MAAELRELRRLPEHPSAKDGAARLLLAWAEHVETEDPTFDNEDVFDASRCDAELSAALEALGLQEPAALGYWFRDLRGPLRQ